jgi:zinc transporter ZupT
MKNWKTTTLGIASIVSAVAGALIAWLKTGSIPDVSGLIAAVTAGWALFHAADAKP